MTEDIEVINNDESSGGNDGEEQGSKTNEPVEKKPELNNQEPVVSGQSEECREKEEIIKDWKNEYDELYDKYIRLYSEFENFRRRTNKEKLDLIDYANTNLILDILPVIDDFERALPLMEKTEDVKSVKEGISLIYNKFRKILEDKGLKEISCIHQDFNPDLHDAISKIAAPKKRLKDKIIDQVLKGYYLKDKVIRHSKVVVGE